MRECWNWQTGKTKDLVGVCSCGFKSHLPQMQKWRNWQTRTVQVRVVEIPCGFDSHLLHDNLVTSSLDVKRFFISENSQKASPALC